MFKDNSKYENKDIQGRVAFNEHIPQQRTTGKEPRRTPNTEQGTRAK
jgi:hypothetical protein